MIFMLVKTLAISLNFGREGGAVFAGVKRRGRNFRDVSEMRIEVAMLLRR